MSKLLKRTFALALIFCLVLSVIPAVSADEPTVYTYSFSSSTGKVAGVVKDAVDTSDATVPYWYYLTGTLSQNSGVKFDKSVNNGMSISSTNAANWTSVVINVPEAGTYDVTMSYCGHTAAPTEAFYLIKVDDANGTSEAGLVTLAGSSNKYTTTSYTGKAQYSTTIRQGNSVFQKRAYSVNGQATLDAGHYILLIKGSSKGTNNYFYAYLSTLTLTKANTAAAVQSVLNTGAFVQLNTWKNGGVSYSEYDLTGTDLQLANATRLDLQGLTLKANSVTGGVVVDIKGNGVLDVNTERTFAENNGYYTYSHNAYPKSCAIQMPVETAENTYKFTDITTKTPAAMVVRPGAEDGTKSFGFDISLMADAYGWDLSKVSVVLEAFVIGQENAGARCDYTDDASAGKVVDWAAKKATVDTADDEVFFVDIANFELLTDETLTFRITVSSAGTSVVTTVGYQNGQVLA